MTMTAAEPRPPRGRPRPAETIARDEQVLSLIKANPDGLTRNEIAEEMGLNTSRAYLSLDRLRRQGLVKKSQPEGSAADKDTLWTPAKRK